MNKNYNTMNNQTCTPKLALAITFLVMSFSQMAFSQAPTVTVRLANPDYTCVNDQYCLDVEFQADADSVQLFGMNVRFFYDDVNLEFDAITDFQGGYGAVSPNPPTVLTSPPGFGTNFFGFPAPGVSDWVNGAVQLVDIGQPAIYISTTDWTKLFQICFNIDGPVVDSNNFCPPVVWDLRLDPSDGGYLAGDDGVVITVVEDPPAMSGPALENVVQFNWMYVGDGSTQPFGEPVENECISIFCTPVITCPADVSIDCNDDTSPDNTGFATASDACMTSVTVTYSDQVNGSGCLQTYTIIRTWTAQNECGELSIPCIQTITVNQLPTLIVRFSNPDYSCLTGEYCLDVELQADMDSVELFGFNVRFFYDDAYMELIGFSDFQGGYGPVAPNPPTVVQSLPGFGTNFFNLPPPGITDWVNGAVQLINTMADPLYISTTDWTKIFQVCFDVHGPVEDSTSFCPPVIWDLEADPSNGGYLSGDDGVVLTIVDDPPAMSGPATENVLQFNWMYTGDGLSAPYGEPVETECLSLLCIPEITCAPDVTIECNESTDPLSTGMASAIDSCMLDVTVSFSDEIDTQNQECAQEFTITRTWIAINECGFTDTCVQLISVIDVDGPAIFCPPDIVIECDESTDPSNTGEATATDLCDPVPIVTYIDITVAGDCPQEYTIDRIWTATDNCGNSNFDLCRQRITIVDSTPPTITCPADLTLECSDPIPSDEPIATDNCSSTLTFTFTDVVCENPIMGFTDLYDISLWETIAVDGGEVTTMGDMQVMLEGPDSGLPCPGGASVLFQITIPSTGQLVFDWDYTSGDVDGTFFDPFGYTLNGTFFQLTADDGPEMQTGTATVTVTAGDIFAFEQRSIDCIFGQGATTVVEFFACVESVEPVCTSLVIRSHTVTDECGNEANCIQTIYLEDTTAPVIVCPTDVTLECDESIDPTNSGLATATDNCDTDIEITYSDVVTPSGVCPQEYSIERTWTATDNCGNATTCLQTISVDDSVPPTITLCPVDVTIECDESTDPADTGGFASATDNCTTAPIVTYSDAILPGACPQEYTVTRTWVATDACGNSSTCLQEITVEDTVAPTITSCPADITVECDESVDPADIGLASATDNCDTAPLVTYSDATVAGACPQEYTITRTWVATDACGNSSTCLQVVSVEDTTPPTISCPGDITLECTDNTTPDAIGAASATDNCDVAPVVTYNDVVEPGACPQESAILRTWTATDACGNSSTCLQTITVDDSTAPTLVCAGDITIECDESTDPADTGVSVATDNCDTAPVVTYSDSVAPGTCPQESTISRTWTATDVCGNSSTCVQTITIEDTTPPTLTCAADITIECDESTDPATTGLASATDNCDTAPLVTYSDVTLSGECPQEYTITRTWTATDACGNATNCIQTITIEDTTAPTITSCPADITVECDESVDPADIGLASATDNCDPAPVVTYSDATVAGACPQEYTITRTWVATDACGNSSTCLQVVSVEDTTPPTISCPGDITLECTDNTTPDAIGAASATDNCDVAPVVTYNDVVEPGACPQESTILRTWTATDACGNSSTCLQTITVDDSTAPTLVCAGDITIECDESTDPADTGVSVATDNCDTAPVVTYSDTVAPGACPQESTISRTWTATDACGNSSTCVQTITIEDTTPPTLTCAADITIECDESTDPATTGLASATDNCDTAPLVTYSDVTLSGECPQEYTITRTWTATDACGNATNCIQTITIEDTTAPTITSCPADITVECDESVDPADIGLASATDNCDPAPVVTYSDATVAGACPQEYTITRTWVATDACGNSSTCLQVVSVEDSTPPVITDCPSDITIECDEDTTPDNTGTASATDNCDTAPVVTFSDSVAPGACPQESTITRTWIATDACGNSSTCIQVIEVDDSTPPTIVCPTDFTLECTDPIPTDLATATDNCSTTVTVTYEDVACDNPTMGFTGPYDFSFWTTVIPVEGGSVTTMSDNEVMLVSPDDVTIDCDDAAVQFSIVIPSTGQIVFDWNYATQDTDGPFFDPFGYNLNGTFFQLTDDNGADIQSGSISIAVTAGDVFAFEQQSTDCGFGEGATTVVEFFACIDQMEETCTSLIIRTHTATDECGNESSCAQTIYIIDTTPPAITCPMDIVIECDASTLPDNTGLATATDNCDSTPEITYSDVITPSTVCPQEYTITRTWTAVDACDNGTNCVQTITVDDSTAPVITDCPADITVECDESVDPADTGIASATDNCDTAPIVTYSDATVAGECPQEYTINRTWVATDACGNSSTCLQVVTVEDTTPPVITDCPSDITIECDEDTLPDNTGGTASATDNCDTAPVVTYSDSVAPGTCPQESTITRTWTATDACGNESSCVQVITVDDSTPPMLQCPDDVTLECDESTDPDEIAYMTTYFDQEALFLSATGAMSVESFEGLPITGMYETVLSLADFDMSTTTDLRVWNMPVSGRFATDGVQFVGISGLNATASTTTYTFGAPINSFGLNITDWGDSGMGQLTFMNDEGDSFVVSVSPSGNGTQQFFGVINTMMNFTTVIFESTADDGYGVDEMYYGVSGFIGGVVAADNCDPAPVVTYSDTVAPGTCPQESTISRTWTATDACGNISTCVQTITIEDTTPPTLTCAADITVECDESTDPATTGLASATDNCDTAPLVTYSDVTIEGECAQEYTITRTWTATDACGNATNCIQTISVEDNTAPVIVCPDDVTIECTDDTTPGANGMASATDNCTEPVVITNSDEFSEGDCPQEYTITRTWLAQDECGNVSSCTQIIVVEDSTPPVLFCPADITIDCTQSPDPADTGEASATDNCDPGGQIGLEVDFSDVTIEDGCPQIIERTWTATDACGNVGTCVQTITIDDTEVPSILCPDDVTVECASDIPPVLTGGVTVSDNCGFVTVTHEDDVVTDSLCVNQFTISRIYLATDECGNTATCAQSIIVDDQTPPSMTCPEDITVTCALDIPEPDITSVTATDNCMDPVVITFGEDVIFSEICDNRFTVGRTYIATDACGNSNSCFQTITVFDDVAPTITCPVDVTVSCAEDVPEVNAGDVVATDNCGGTVTISHQGDVISDETCPNRFTVTRTYSATDDCGNSATCIQVITVFDNTPPTITCPDNITVTFGDSTEPEDTGNPTGTDNCGGTPDFTFTDEIVPGPCDEEFTIIRTWTATDSCGVTATCLQEIFVDGDCNLDLALTKVLLFPAEVNGGDDVVFDITITNQGEVTVGEVIITDYIPLGFTLNDPDWTPGTQGSTGQSASISLSVANGGLDANGLNPGEFVTVQITLMANEDVSPSCYMNFAEISFIFDINGNDISDEDIDSVPDEDDTNDAPAEDDIDDAVICVQPAILVDGDPYVCPGEIVTYCVSDYNPEFVYEWALNGGGTIIGTTDECITVQWQEEPGGPFEISVNAIACAGCNTIAFLNVYIQGVETLACNDYVQISLGAECESVVLSGMILEGEAEGNNNYFVIITDENGNVIPDATLTSEHIGQCFTVTVANECNDQSCWGTICVEDKIPPVIECTDVTVSCGTSLEPVFAPPVTGVVVETVTPGSAIGPNAGDVTTQELILDVPANAVVTDVDITIDLDHTWVGDLTVQLISPAGTTVLLVDQLCGSVDNWDNVIFDDQAGLAVTAACSPIPPALAGSLIPQGSLASINGQSAVGVWTLVITDQVGGDGGTLNLVSLDVEYYLAVPSAPFASDACGEVELTYTDEQSGDACEELILTRTWTATDGSGNTATCIQNITITPLTLDNVDFPLAYEGQCGESIHPDFTGWPTVDGTPITDESDLCNIFVGYWDKELAECGGGRKIVRTWTVLDWCEVELVEAIQVIKLTDDEGPELTCPSNLTVGTDFWYCYANVSVPKPIAIDECSEIGTYSLVSSSGIVVSFGNNYVINGLELGTHIVTWTVSDECGNSSTCSFTITVVDDVVPVANCDAHTIVSLTNDGPSGVTLVPASVFDDGSYDNCGPVTFRARRMDSCIEFDWTTEGACIDDVPGGIPPVNSRDRGTVHRPCVPFACCDVGAGPIMVELEVTDAAGNINYCMIEATVQDKISPFVVCPPDIIVSCDFWFNVQEGTFVDGEGNNDGSLDEDPLSNVFGNMFDGFRYDESIRQDIIINDPGNDELNQPYNWGIDGWADDNCEVNLSVRVRVIDDCSGDDLPGNAPDGAIKLIERRFSAADGNEGVAPGTCTQRIWVVDFEPFYITDQTCNNPNPQDGVIWPCDVLLTTCPEDLGNTGEPTIFDDACSLIGVTYEDQRFDFVDDACFKILREWSVIDWCQYNSQTGAGLWKYTQVIKVHDEEGPTFVEPCETQVLCVADEGVSLPDNNQAFLGENNPLASSCSVHLNLSRVIHETCSETVSYDVKIYPFNGTEFILIKPTSTATVDENNDAVLSFDTRQSTIQSIRLNGLPYNSVSCGDYHRILWSVEDGCGNWSHCEYLLRLEDCKQPSPVCINGLSTVVMPVGGEVTIWAKDFNASSFDDCTPADELLYSFSGETYQPSFTYNCENIPAFNVELATEIWVADGGTDDNCNGIISWNERNIDFCTTTIVITDNNDVCGGTGSILAGEIFTEQTAAIAQVAVALTSPGHFFPQYVTAQDGKFVFNSVPLGDDYMITPERNDGHRNGVSTLDLVRIQKHLLGKEEFTSPYQYIAADANNTQSLSAIDLIEIRKLILGIYTEFPNNKSWRFVEKGFPMDNDNPWPFSENIEIQQLAHDSMMYNDFVGVKIGDVNNSAQANSNQILPRNGRRVLNVELDAPTDVVAGEMVVVKLRIPEVMEGFQWTLETEGLAFESVTSETMKITDSHVGILNNGVITMSWHAEDQEALSTAQVVTMSFIAMQSGTIREMIQLSGRVTEAEAYTSAGEILDVKLGQTNVAPEFALYQNMPNPWNEVTTVGFDLPADASVTFTLFEASGKVVKTIERDCKAGYNTISLNAQEIPTSGVMYYRLESGEYSASKKMVLIK